MRMGSAVERATRVEIAEREFDRHPREIGGNLGDPVGHLLDAVAGEALQEVQGRALAGEERPCRPLEASHRAPVAPGALLG